MLENKPVSKPPKESFGAFLGYSPPRLRVLGGHHACQRTDTNQNFWGRCWKMHSWVGRDLKARQSPTLRSSRGSQGTLAHLHKAKSVPRHQMTPEVPPASTSAPQVLQRSHNPACRGAMPSTGLKSASFLPTLQEKKLGYPDLEGERLAAAREINILKSHLVLQLRTCLAPAFCVL